MARNPVAKMSSKRALSTALAAGALLAGLAASPAAAQTSSTGLTGETLACSPGPTDATPLGDPGRICPAGSDSPMITEARCDPEGGRFDFSVEGTAAGPFPGTFTETGTVVLGPEEGTEERDNARQLKEVTAEFRIDSPQGTVTGRKRLENAPLDDEAPIINFGVCSSGSDGTVSGLTAASVLPGSLCYEAELPDGEVDSGRASLLVGRDTLDDGRFLRQFIEEFTSDPTVACGFPPDEEPPPPPPPPPAVPVAKDQCKSGGFREFPSLGFKNQGDCVSFVATGGKNRPSGNRP